MEKKKLFDEKAQSDCVTCFHRRGRAKTKRESFLNFFWLAHVKDDLEKVGLAIQTKAEFSCAVTVMDKIGGWEEGNEQEDQIGARFGASVWIHTKAVFCNDQRNMENFMIKKDDFDYRRSTMGLFSKKTTRR